MNVLNILNSPWAILPEKLTEMCAIYAAHRNGDKADLAAVEAALGRPLEAGGAKPYEVHDGVAVLPLEGVLSKRMGLFSQISGGQSYQSFQSELQQALADPKVTAIILSIDSPGGSVDGMQQAADAVFAARSLKPVCALVNGTMCSAAYMIGSSAAKVYISSDMDVVGSIGVVTQHVDTSAAEYMSGIKVTDITAGKYKRIASQHAPLSPEGRGAIQDQLDHVYGVFVDAVARNRGVDADTVLNKMADGRVFTGKQAITAGLVDGKMTLPQLVQKMSGQVGTSVARRNAANRIDAPKPVPGSLAPTLPVQSSETSNEPAQSKPAAPSLSKAELQIGKLRVLKAEESSTRRLLHDAEATLKTARGALSQASRTGGNVDFFVPFTTAAIRAEETVRNLRDRLRQIDLEQWQVLKDKDTARADSLAEAEAAARTASAALFQAARTNRKPEELVPYVTAQIEAEAAVRSLRG